MRGPSLTYASVTSNWSTSTSFDLFSALAIADRSTFSTSGAKRLLVARRIVIALPACWPRMRSMTRRAFCADPLTYLASALASILRVPFQLRLRTLLGGSLRRVALERTRGRKLAELVPDHVLRHVHGNELLPAVHSERVAD